MFIQMNKWTDEQTNEEIHSVFCRPLPKRREKGTNEQRIVVRIRKKRKERKERREKFLRKQGDE